MISTGLKKKQDRERGGGGIEKNRDRTRLCWHVHKRENPVKKKKKKRLGRDKTPKRKTLNWDEKTR